MRAIVLPLLLVLLATVTHTDVHAQALDIRDPAAAVPEAVEAAGLLPQPPAGPLAREVRQDRFVLEAPDIAPAAGLGLGLQAESGSALAAVPSATLMQPDRRRGLTWVIVGAALIGAGMVIEGDAGSAVSVGGAVVAAYGVFLMVRR